MRGPLCIIAGRACARLSGRSPGGRIFRFRLRHGVRQRARTAALSPVRTLCARAVRRQNLWRCANVVGPGGRTLQARQPAPHGRGDDVPALWRNDAGACGRRRQGNRQPHRAARPRELVAYRRAARADRARGQAVDVSPANDWSQVRVSSIRCRISARPPGRSPGSSTASPMTASRSAARGSWPAQAMAPRLRRCRPSRRSASPMPLRG